MPLKILYLGNYLDGTGWGNAAEQAILALDSAGVEVVPRVITFNDFAGRDNVNKRILELQTNSFADNIDICIQHTLPELYIYNDSCKHIARFESETNDLRYSLWPKYINLLDEAWVPNRQAHMAAISSGVTKPVKIAHHCIDISKYEKIEKTATVTELNHSFNFCFVGEFTSRKNISALLTAFHIEFHPSENINLFLKLNISGMNSNKVIEQFNNVNEKIKAGLRIRNKYKNPVIITGMLPENQLKSIMKQCHCFVCSSNGEAWCIPALEAMAMGMRVIYPKGSGLQEFACDTGFSFDVNETPCMGLDTLPNLQTAFDTWNSPDINSLCIAMRYAYNAYQHAEKNAWSDHPKIEAARFDYKEVGKRLKELL